MNNKTLIRGALMLAAMIGIALAMVLVARSGSDAIGANKEAQRTFFEQFIVSGGPIVWFVLMPMSLLTVFLAFDHCLRIRRKSLLPNGIAEEIIENIQHFGTDGFVLQTKEHTDLVTFAITKALTQGKGDWFRMKSILAESLQDQASALFRRIEWINLIGNVTPMVGLFGTVFGMIKLFNAIVVAGGQPQPAQLAEGISVALVTTFWGLFIAIPALALHGVFRNRIETFANDAVVETENIMPMLREALQKAQRRENTPSNQRIKEIPPKTGAEKKNTVAS